MNPPFTDKHTRAPLDKFCLEPFFNDRNANTRIMSKLNFHNNSSWNTQNNFPWSSIVSFDNNDWYTSALCCTKADNNSYDHTKSNNNILKSLERYPNINLNYTL